MARQSQLLDLGCAPYVLYGVKYIDLSGSHPDLIRAPYVLYGAKYIDPFPCTAASGSRLDLGRAPYLVYGVKYIGPVPLAYGPVIIIESF